MANEQVRIDLTANDKASRTIDDVADSAEALEKLDPEVQVTADDKASDDLAGIRDDAEALDKLDPKVTVTADDKASDDIRSVRDDAEALARTDAEIVLRARIDNAKANLADLQAELKQTGDKADTTVRQLDRVGDKGPGLRGNAIADLTGPLGEASGAASDFAGVFDGLGDISESVAGKIGVNAAAMTTAITGIGVAVAAGAALWTFYRQKQEAARQRTQELEKAQRDFNKAVKEGRLEDAAAKLVEAYGDAYDAARKAQIPVSELTRYITGQSDELPTLTQRTRDLADARDDFAHSGKTIDELNHEERALSDLTGTLDDARKGYKDANGSIAEQDRVLREVQGQLTRTTGSTRDLARAQDDAAGSAGDVNDQLDRMRGALDMDQAIIDWRDAFAAAMNDNDQTMDEQASDVIALKQAIIDAGEAVGKSPWQIQTELDKVDAGDMQAVKTDVENWYKMYPIIVASKLDRPGQLSGGLTGTSGAGPRAVEQTIVNMTLPAGWRGDPIRAAHGQRRRAGRYYART